MKTLRILDTDLEIVRLASAHPRPGAPAMVLLHEGLGSISLWRDFPQQLADATGCEAVVYSRYGYGRSTPRRGEARSPRYMHDEALQVLPALLEALELDRPFLVGHSDGGSIALIHAGGTPGPLSGVVVMAPHVMVEEVTLAGIREAVKIYGSTDLPSRLSRHHRDADSVFRAWHEIWLSPAFRDWNIEEYLPRIACPVMAIQGEDDEYGTLAQIDRIAGLAPDVDLVKLADCRHSPHRDQPGAILEAVSGFVARVLDGQDEAA